MNLPIVSADTLRKPLESAERESDEPIEARGTVYFASLGCPKNLVDSERMLGLLANGGYIPVNRPEGADLVVVNTCGFIEAARQESRAVIDEMLAIKARGDCGGVIVTGCLAERLGDQILTEIPQIDQAVGVFGREEIVDVADRYVRGAVEQRTVFRPAAIKALDDQARVRVTPRHYAYLKISEGCDRLCTFCAIPRMRGKHVTKPIEQVLAEAEELVADGVRELVLVSQDATYYGKDLYGEVRLADLLRQLDQIDGLNWIRLLYAYPEHVNDRLIESMATAKRIVPYIDMPLQHINDRVLKRMQRRVDRAATIEILDRLRKGIPGLVLRTTFIVGFPGETEDQFRELEEFVTEGHFQRAGVFTYSWEEGTPATRLDGHLDETVKQERRERLYLAQQKVAFDHAERQVGQTIEVVIDERRPGGRKWICRSKGDAPTIDTNVILSARGSLNPGDFVDVRITGRKDYDLLAKLPGSAEATMNGEAADG